MQEAFLSTATVHNRDRTHSDAHFRLERGREGGREEEEMELGGGKWEMGRRGREGREGMPEERRERGIEVQ